MRPWADGRAVAVLALLALLVVAVPAAGATGGGEQSAASGGNATVDLASWNATVWTGPPTVRERLVDRAAIERATRNGTLTRNHTVTPAHTVVFELYAPELDGRVVDADGPNQTMRFFAATHGPDSVLRLEQQNPLTEFDPLVAALNDTDATRVVTDGRNDTYYLVVDPSALEYYRGAGEWSYRKTGRLTLFQAQRQWDLREGEILGLEARFEGTYREFGERRDGGDTFVRFRDVDLASPGTSRRSFFFRRVADQRVRLRGSVPAGTTATVRIADRLDDGPTLVRTVTFRRPEAGNATGRQTVAETAFDLGNLSAGVSFDVVVRRGSWELESWDGAVEPDSPHVAAGTQDDWRSGRIEVQCVSLPRRAHVVVAPGRWAGLRGSELYPEDGEATAFEASTHRNLTVEFEPDWAWESAEYATVVAAVDGSGDGEIWSSEEQDYPLVVNGTVVAETVRLANGSAGERVQSTGQDEGCASAQTPDARDQQSTTTAEPTPATETGVESTSADQTTATTSSGVGPGFGAVAGAVGVLLAAVVGSVLRNRSREN